MALAAAQLAIVGDNLASTGQALKLFAVARFRQRQSLDAPEFDGVLARLAADEPAADLLRFWRSAIAQRIPCRLDASTNGASEVQARQSSPAALCAIEARANGSSLPLVFIDTGAQHSLMTTAAARRAGVTIGKTATQLVGFAGLQAQPAVLETLQLGGLTLHDVPILVGDSVPLLALNGQMTLGTELMHHVCFTVDYPAGRVLVEPANRDRSVARSESNWQIPLWTFSQACLVQGRTAGGAGARTLVDTGNRSGTFVSPRWARQNLPRYQPPGAGLVFKFKQRDLTIESLELGDHSLDDWPVVDMLPGSLERLDLVDLLVGHDLLRSYRVTLDIAARTLLLQGNVPPTVLADERVDNLEASRDGGD
jgi:predicted aspartyl protease